MTTTLRTSATATPLRMGRFLIPLLTSLAFFSFAYNQAAPAGGAESAYLALLAGGVLAAIAVLAPAPAWELLLGALLATTILWIVDYGPHRGAVLSLSLALFLVSAAVRHLHHRARHDLASSASYRLAMALAFGLQLLTRGDLLLPPLLDPRTLVSVFLLPVVAGLALALIAECQGSRRALVVGCVVFVLAPGWNVTACLALLAVAAGAVLGDRRQSYARRWVALLLLMLPTLLRGSIGALASLVGLTLALPKEQRWVPTLGMALLGLWLPGPVPWREALTFLVLIPLLLPSLPSTPWRKLGLLAPGLLAVLVANHLGAGRDGMAAGIALLALALPEHGVGARLQRGWSLLLAAGALLLAAYPWVRLDPLADALGLMQLGSDWPSALWLLALLPGLGLLLHGLGKATWANSALGGIVVLALAANLSGPAIVPISFREVVLDTKHPNWVYELPADGASDATEWDGMRVVADSNLVQGAEVALGTKVGEIRLLTEDGKLLQRLPLIAGVNTGEWAAGRADVAGRPGFHAPDPFLSYVAPDGSFFGRRFRARSASLGSADQRPAKVVILRAAGLPDKVRLVIYRLELRS